MSATVGHTLDVARSQLGVHESPQGSNCQKYSTYWHHPCESWCADFLCFVLKTAGSLDVPMSAYTPTLAENYQRAHRWGHTPRPGAVTFFEWPGMGRISHVGLVEAVRSDGSIVDIEGNTDEAGGRTGGKVMRHVRRSYIVGYGYPSYRAGTKAAPPRAASHPTLRNGSAGAAVTDLQRKLNAHGNHLTVDGQFGDRTEYVVRHFQAVHHLAVDGVVGPHTWAALDAR